MEHLSQTSRRIAHLSFRARKLGLIDQPTHEDVVTHAAAVGVSGRVDPSGGEYKDSEPAEVFIETSNALGKLAAYHDNPDVRRLAAAGHEMAKAIRGKQ